MTKRISRRQMLKGSASVASLLALSACGTPNTETTASPSANGSPAAIGSPVAEGSVAATPAPQTGSGTGITYWGSFSGRNGEVEQELVNKFNESQDEVVLDYQFQGSYEETAQKLTAALQSNTAPDVILLSDVWWFRFYLANQLQPLDDLYADAGIEPGDYVDVLFKEGVRQGQSYWVPFARSTPLFYYNKQIWEEVGLPDRGPETWDEFEEWAPQIVQRDGNELSRAAFVHPDAASYIAWLFQGVAWQFGGQYSTPNFEMTMTDPNTVEAGEFYRSTVHGDNAWAIFSNDIVRDFISGVAAAGMFSTGSMGGILRDAQFDVGTAFLPKKDQFGCCTGGAGLAILRNTPAEKQQAAMKWIAFATSPENTVFWAKNTGYMPVRQSAIESEEMQQYFEENPTFRTAVDQLPQTQPQDVARVFVPNGDQIIGKGLERIVVNNEDPQASFETVNNELTQAAQPVIQSLQQVEG